MTNARLLFLGRTGVGKSSLINFFAGEERCNTDCYRACTKMPATILVKYGEKELELIDTPGLCESGDGLDSLYLDLIDRYLLDQDVFPDLVFKCDDTRLRTEDYKLLKTLLIRYGNRILQNGGLMLTFAGNLQGEYDNKIIKRVKSITNAICDIQISLGIELFQGFQRITLVDSELKTIYKIKNPDNGIIVEDIVAALNDGNQCEIVSKAGINPKICESILSRMFSNQRRDKINLNEMLLYINLFPYHNLNDNKNNELLFPKQVAANPNTSVETLSILANDDDEEVRLEVAQNLNTSAEMLEILANDYDADVRRMVAENSKTPAEVLNILVNDEDYLVRLEVANNPNTAVNSLKILAFDYDAEVRWGVAKNPNTPVEVLKVLVNDDVRFWDANDLNIPIEILKIFATDYDADIRKRVANNPSTPVEILNILANDEDPLVRRIVAINCNTPQETLQFLKIDEDANVRLEVSNNPNTPIENSLVIDEEKVENPLDEDTGYKFAKSVEGIELEDHFYENETKPNIHYEDGDFDNFWNIEGVFESESDKSAEMLTGWENALVDSPDDPSWGRQEKEEDGQEHEESYQEWAREQEKITEAIEIAKEEYYARQDQVIND